MSEGQTDTLKTARPMCTNRVTHLHVPCKATPSTRRALPWATTSRKGEEKAHPGRPGGAGPIVYFASDRGSLGSADLDRPHLSGVIFALAHVHANVRTSRGLALNRGILSAIAAASSRLVRQRCG